MYILNCPRCGEHKLELMKSYGFCWECGYSPELGHCPSPQSVMIHKFFHKAPVDHALEHLIERAS
jgi:hypothetical protein